MRSRRATVDRNHQAGASGARCRSASPHIDLRRAPGLGRQDPSEPLRVTPEVFPATLKAGTRARHTGRFRLLVRWEACRIMLANYDVIVVGAGNAAFCAAHAAREAGARGVMLERAPEAESGGNNPLTPRGGPVRHPR